MTWWTNQAAIDRSINHSCFEQPAVGWREHGAYQVHQIDGGGE